MRKYKLLSAWLLICLVFSGFTYRGGSNIADTSEPGQAQNVLQETTAVPDTVFYKEDIPEIVGYETAAAERYTKRLREEEKSLNEVIFRDTDGVNTQYLYAFPVKYSDGGKIKDKTLHLETDQSNGKTVFRSASNDIVTSFGENSSDGIRLEYKEISLLLKPETKARDLKQSEASSLPEFAADQKSVSFRLNPQITRSISLTYMGFSEEIVLQKAAGQNEFVSRLYTNGLELYQNGFGQLLLRNADGETAAYVSDAAVFTADDRNNRLLSYTFETVVPREEYLLRLTLPAEYLTDEATVYPLSLNNSIEINTNGAIEDVTINSGAGSSGTSGSLYIGKRDSFGISRTLMKFPGLNLSSIAANQIVNASVEIRDLLCESQVMKVNCHAFTGNTWSEASANWSGVSPNSYSSSYSTRSVSYGNGNAPNDSQRYSFDVTSIVRSWANGTYDKNKGILFKAEDTIENGGTYIHKTFASSNNSSYKPCLKVEYSSITPTVTFNAREITIRMGSSRQLEYTRSPENIGAINWVNSNYSALSISASGVVTPYFPGRYSVTILLYYNGSYVSNDICYITVLPQQSVSSGVYKIQNKYSGKYLSSNSNASVTLTTALPVGYDGSQLWFIENYGNFCMIYSLGLHDISTLGAKEMVLTTNSSGSTLLLYSEYANCNKWIITCANTDEYFISQYEIVNKGFKSNGLSTTPILANINHNNEDAKWNLVRIQECTFNNYYGGSIGQGNRLYVKVQVDASAYKNGIFHESDINGYLSWVGLSYYVMIYGPNETVPADVTPYIVTIKGSEKEKDFPENRVAFFTPLNGSDPTFIWENFNRGEITIDVRTNGNCAKLDSVNRKLTITHEFGHAFKLAHPHVRQNLANTTNGRGGYYVLHNVASIMNQGSAYDVNKNVTSEPSTHDIINFRNKWGY